jgi:hypothetical protein
MRRKMRVGAAVLELLESLGPEDASLADAFGAFGWPLLEEEEESLGLSLFLPPLPGVVPEAGVSFGVGAGLTEYQPLRRETPRRAEDEEDDEEEEDGSGGWASSAFTRERRRGGTAAEVRSPACAAAARAGSTGAASSMTTSSGRRRRTAAAFDPEYAEYQRAGPTIAPRTHCASQKPTTSVVSSR